MSPNGFNTDFDNLDFSLTIQVISDEHADIVASGIFDPGIAHCLACHFFSAGPFLIILIPLERGGLCDHLKSNFIKIGPRSSEISSVKHWDVENISAFTY